MHMQLVVGVYTLAVVLISCARYSSRALGWLGWALGWLGVRLGLAGGQTWHEPDKAM